MHTESLHNISAEGEIHILVCHDIQRRESTPKWKALEETDRNHVLGVMTEGLFQQQKTIVYIPDSKSGICIWLEQTCVLLRNKR